VLRGDGAAVLSFFSFSSLVLLSFSLPTARRLTLWVPVLRPPPHLLPFSPYMFPRSFETGNTKRKKEKNFF
jgi:hypothetical protein